MDPKSLEGLKKDEAIAKAKGAGFKTRIRSEDGDRRLVTMDHRKDRINLWIEQGVVTKASIG